MKISYLFNKLMNVIFIYTRMIVHISCYSVIIKQFFLLVFQLIAKNQVDSCSASLYEEIGYFLILLLFLDYVSSLSNRRTVYELKKYLT